LDALAAFRAAGPGWQMKPEKATTSISARRSRPIYSDRPGNCWPIFGKTSKTGVPDMKNIVTLGVTSQEEITEKFVRAWETGEPQGAHIGFLNIEAMWETLTPKRWAILRAMTGAGPLALREVARRVERDVKAVHGDVHALLNAGLLDKTENGKLVFPYDAVHVDFTLKAA
jgi:predicted transcriptional regulator